MRGGVQDGFGSKVGVVLLRVAGPGCNRVDQLPVGERVAVSPEVRGQNGRGLRSPGADVNRRPASLSSRMFRGREYASVGDDEHVRQPVC